VVAAIGWLGVMAAYRWVPTRILKYLLGAYGDEFPKSVSTAASAIIEWRHDVDWKRALVLAGRIDKQLSACPNHPWAGAYCAVIGARDVGLFLGPDQEFVRFFSKGCFSFAGASESGSVVQVTDGSVLLQTTGYSIDTWEPDEVWSRLHRVRWGLRSFLTRDWTALDRSDADPITFESLVWALLTRKSDPIGPLAGWPELPPEIARRFAGFPDTVGVVAAWDEILVNDEFDPEQGDAEYRDTAYRTVSIELGGESSVACVASVVGLYGPLPLMTAYRDGALLRIQDRDPNSPLPQIGWRFAILSADWDDNAVDHVSEIEADVVAQNEQPDR
jgi:hypothetical protein